MRAPCSGCSIPMAEHARGKNGDIAYACIHTGCDRWMRPVVVIRHQQSDDWERDCDLQYGLWLYDREQYGEARGTEDQLVYSLMQRWHRSELAIIGAIMESVK
jgi:hypothetical protein